MSSSHYSKAKKDLKGIYHISGTYLFNSGLIIEYFHRRYYAEMVFYGSMGAYVECSTFSTSSIFNEGQTSEAFDEKQDIATSGDVTTEKQVYSVPLLESNAFDSQHTWSMVNAHNYVVYLELFSPGIS